MTNPSLYDRLGGNAALDQAVDLFYDKLLADDRVKHFFDTVDMPAQRAKQKIFLAYAFGGPVKYDGKDMRNAHAHLDITDEHFTAVAENLRATLEELGVPEQEIGEVLAIAGAAKSDVINE